ncbi:MAG: class I SAM-dependent methyltransferase [Alphaproteobacteria bacterium]
MKIFKKIKSANGRRKIYLLGIKILSYKNKKNIKFCPICNNENTFNGFGTVLRKDAMCPVCRSLERHRFLFFIYNLFFLQTTRKIKVLHIAPEKAIYDMIIKNSNIEYHHIDIDPSQYPYALGCKQMNALNLQFKDETFDFIIHNQVIEHIVDEQKFINEQLRVLKDNGKIIVNLPYKSDLEKTFQDDNIKTDEDRLKYYLQKDHVRLYGLNMLENLKGVNIERIFEDFMTTKLINEMQLKRNFIDLEDAYFLITKKERK